MPFSDVDPTERSFLQSIAANPEDARLGMVYGDWLEEQGRWEQATFIRLTARANAGDAGVFGGDLAIDFRWCPAGTFEMGSPESEPGHVDKENQVGVTLTRHFWISRTTVTQELWRNVIGTEPWAIHGDQYGPYRAGPIYPAMYVNWADVTEFCSKLTERERRAERVPPGWTFELPTEAQWEYACRAGTTTAYFCGSDELNLGDHAWFAGNVVDEPYAREVGRREPNAWGLCDMHGNVSEWCSDWFASSLPGGRDPRGPLEGSLGAVRSGGAGDTARHCRSASRSGFAPRLRFSTLGFRLALSPSGP